MCGGMGYHGAFVDIHGFHPVSRQTRTAEAVDAARVRVDAFQRSKQYNHKQSFFAFFLLFVLVGKHLAEPLAGAVVQLPGVVCRDVQHPRDAPVRVPLHGVEVEHGALNLRQFSDGCQQFLLREIHRPDVLVLHSGDFGNVIRFQRHEIRLSTQVIDAMVYSDVCQPGIKTPYGAYGRELLHRLHENVLRQVLRHRPVVHISVTYRDNPAEIMLVFPLPKFHHVHSNYMTQKYKNVTIWVDNYFYCQ